MADFFELFGLPFLACLLMTGVLSLLGIHVLKREVIFVDIALAQAAALGAIVAHVAFHAHGDSPVAYAAALAATFICAAGYALVRRRVTNLPLEAVIGVTYAIFAAVALFVAGAAPGGHVHVRDMLAGSLLLTTGREILLCAVAFALAAALFVAFRRPMSRISDDYDRAVAAGMRVVLWDFLFYCILGVVVTLALRTGGIVVVFSFLIIPASVSALFATRPSVRLAAAWAVGVVASAAGLVFADRFDFSVGPSIALMLGVLLVMASLLPKRLRAAHDGRE